MKFFRCLLFLSLIISIALCYPSQVLASRITTIIVDVDQDKANKKNWDFKNGNPDIAICVSHSLVGTLCLPEGDNIFNVRIPQCKDSYHCRFSVEIPDRNFKISVIDVDLQKNDLIGTGHCHQGKTCFIGEAEVTIK